MTKETSSPLILEMHGNAHGKAETVVDEAPHKQDCNTTQAHAYALAAMEDPEMWAHYQQEGHKKKKSAYSMAFSSFFKVHRKLGE